MLLYILFVILGFCLLIGGANILVNGASSIAKRFHVSDLLIGLTIVAFGTTAPELIVNIISSIQGSNDLVIGNIIGSNIANILLILGLSASLHKIHLANSTVWKEIPFALLGAILLGILINDNLFVSNSISVLGAVDGLILLSIFAIFLYYVIRNAIRYPSSVISDMLVISRKRSITLVLGGLVGLGIGGYLVIENAISIAQSIGWSERLIGLTVIALGTSMPELITSIVAILKRKSSMAV
jgi:cation:H+ antiporter